jgi:AcrR family transcriptional regulator
VPTDLVSAFAAPRLGASDVTAERILDAALVELGARGIGASTADDIASRAGVGRVTVFRKFGSKDGLVQALVVRELQRFIATVDAAIEPIDDPAERVAEAFVATVRTSASHPLVARLARFEPGAALERLAVGDPSPLDLARAYVAGKICEDGVTPPDRAAELADVLTRLATMYVLVPSRAADLSTDEGARDFARRVLGPLVR